MKVSLVKRVRPTLVVFSIAALVMIGMSAELWAKKPQNPGGYTTLCEGSAARDVNGNTLSVTQKVRQGVKAGKDPLRLETESTLGSSTLTTISAPADGALLNKIVVKVDPTDCTIVGPSTVTFHFSDGTVVDPEDENAPNISPSDQEVFDATKVPLGYGDVAFPTEEGEELVEAVCNFVKDQINMGLTFDATQAGDIGAMIGSLWAELGRCISATLIEFQDASGNVVNSCDGDDIASNLFLSLLSGAPSARITVTSHEGLYTITNLANGTSASVSVNGDGSCDADEGDFSYDPEDPNNDPPAL